MRPRSPGTGTAWRGASQKALLVVEAFTGLTALGAGVLLMARPDGSLLGMTPSALAAMAGNSPFSDFFIPGCALAVFIGGGMLGAALLLFQHRPYALELAMASGTALVIFEVVEFIAIGFMPLQAFEVVVGMFVLDMASRRWWAALRPLRHARR